MQSTNTIMMIRPSAFGYDAETAVTNTFQRTPVLAPDMVQVKALEEFDLLAQTLRDYGVSLHVVNDSVTPEKPDAVFSNNWISTHEDGTVILYPMQSKSRRMERREDILDELSKYFTINEVLNLGHYENEGKFLEGTGSLVFDRDNGLLFACRSPRTSDELVHEVGKKLGFATVIFDAVDENNNPLYHTNIMLSIGTRFAVIADHSIPDEHQRKRVIEALEDNGRRVVKLRPGQMNSFAANILEVEGRSREVVMSNTAYHSLSDSQRDIIELFASIIHCPVDTIESVGGGSVRCMMTEIFLPRR